MNKHLWRLVLIILGTVLLMMQGYPVKAKDGIRIESDLTHLDFPHGISFNLNIRDMVVIDQVQLVYWTNARSCLSSSARQEIKIQKSTWVNASWDWETAGLPPGAEVTWQWQIHDTAGNTLTTPEKKLVVTDNRYTWRTLQSGGIRVEWADGDYTFGNLLISTAASSLARLAKEAGIPQPNQARLIIYPSSDELLAAAPELSDWAGGVAYPSYGTIMIGIPPDETDWLAKVIPHELAHLVVDQRIDNCAGNRLPTWLDEGLAMFAEGATPAEDQKLVLAALRNGAIQPFLGLTAGFPDDSSRANLAYAQSGMVISFLVEQFGAENIDKMLLQVQQGKAIDSILRDVYGLDTAGIDQAWRASLGFGSAPPAATASPTTAARRTAVATFALYTAVPTTSPSPTVTITLPATLPPATSTPQPSPIPPATLIPTATPSAPAEPTGLPGWVWVLAGVIGLAVAAGIFWRLKKH